MRIYIISTGTPLGLAYHLNVEGHTVNSTYTVGNITFSNLPNPDMSILDAVSDPKAAELLRNKGVKVLGIDSWVRLLETDESYKHAFIRALGYNVALDDTVGDRVTVSCLFNGNKFISKMLVFPYKRMMSCDVGTLIDCSGYVTYFDVEKSKLVNDILDPLEKFLKKASHRGHFAIDCIIDKHGAHVDNVSASMSKAYITSVFENTRLHKTDVLLKMFDENAQPIVYTDPWGAGVLVSISPYPHLIPKATEKVTGFNPMNLKHFWLIDVRQDGDNWICGENSGCLGFVTSRGVSIQEVTRRVYRTLSNISVESIQFRSDVGKDVYTRYDKLKELKLVS